MESLPDDVLVLVLCLLDTRQLVRVRAVCRRWRDLALEPVLWRHRELFVDQDDLFSRTVLSLAPRLKTLCLYTDSSPSAEDDTSLGTALGALAVQTHCGAEKLNLVAVNLAQAALIVQRQVELGRLTEVYLRIETRRPDADATDGHSELLLALCRGGFRTLDISYSYFPILMFNDTGFAFDQATPSLLVLRYAVCLSLDVALALLLRAHAGTLEDVAVTSSKDLTASTDFPALPSLRRLTCPLLHDMTALLQSPRLESLQLSAIKDRAEGVNHMINAAAFFRQATWLKALTLNFSDQGLESPAALDMVSVIGDSGLAELELLEFLDFHFWDSTALMQRLAASVRGLPRLRRLHVRYTVFQGDLLGILLPAAGAAPKLGTLVVEVSQMGMAASKRCLHALSHSRELRDALRRNPGLHLQLVVTPNPCAGPLPDCSSCAAGCHPELQGLPEAACVGLYAHPDGSEPCALHEAITFCWVADPLRWLRIHTEST